MIRISAIIPCYNVELWIDRCMESLMSQKGAGSEFELECIFIDDGSADKTLEAIQEAGFKKIIELSKNKGVVNARNEGLAEATGNWISFIDPDDYIASDFYRELLKMGGNDRGIDIIKGTRTYEGGYSQLNQNVARNPYMLTYEWQSAIYRQGICNHEFTEGLTTAQDVEWLTRTVIKNKGKPIPVTHKALYHYTEYREGSSCSKLYSEAKMASVGKAYAMSIESLEKELALTGDQRIHQAIQMRLHSLSCLYAKGETQGAMRIAWEAWEKYAIKYRRMLTDQLLL
jgi:glycosyltransferase involved in cell wall biosynthesis